MKNRFVSNYEIYMHQIKQQLDAAGTACKNSVAMPSAELAEILLSLNAEEFAEQSMRVLYLFGLSNKACEVIENLMQRSNICTIKDMISTGSECIMYARNGKDNLGINNYYKIQDILAYYNLALRGQAKKVVNGKFVRLKSFKREPFDVKKYLSMFLNNSEELKEIEKQKISAWLHQLANELNRHGAECLKLIDCENFAEDSEVYKGIKEVVSYYFMHRIDRDVLNAKTDMLSREAATSIEYEKCLYETIVKFKQDELKNKTSFNRNKAAKNLITSTLSSINGTTPVNISPAPEKRICSDDFDSNDKQLQ